LERFELAKAVLNRLLLNFEVLYIVSIKFRSWHCLCYYDNFYWHCKLFAVCCDCL